ncbi:hypothetical protein ACIBI0_38390 [Microbispora rosea]|uniref:hypothetical protein n=1 Tax=Microbispora rosea TaxID=58117 RepID=UPI0037AF7F48
MPFRVRDKYRANPAAIYVEEYGGHVTPDPRMAYADDDPMVKARPEYFIQEGQEDDPAPESVRIADVVEQATRAPGEKRTGPPRRTRKPQP